MTQEDLIWMAGFFDGEGCIAIQKQKSSNGSYNYNLDVGVGQKYPEPLEVFSTVFGRPVVRQGTEAFQWKTSGRKAYQMLKVILPYLRFKTDQALIAIEYQENYFKCTSDPATKWMERRRLGEDAYKKLQDVKRRIENA